MSDIAPKKQLISRRSIPTIIPRYQIIKPAENTKTFLEDFWDDERTWNDQNVWGS